MTEAHEHVWEVDVRYPKTDGLVDACTGSIQKKQKGSQTERVEERSPLDGKEKPNELDLRENMEPEGRR